MTVRELKAQVAEANRRLTIEGLVSLSFGNASGIDRDAGVVAIKPSGLACDRVTPTDVVVLSLVDGRVVEGSLRPSSDTPTHLELYRRFDSIGGVVHTHSPFASAWAQAKGAIPCFGTTHADHFAGPVPVTRTLTEGEIAGDYEAATGGAIAEGIEALGLDPLHTPAALVSSHGPFTWGTDPDDAVTNAVALELVAAMAFRSEALAPSIQPIGDALLIRHFERKHGPGATYGQPPGRHG